MFKPVITPDVVGAYGICKRKAFLLLEGNNGAPHEYERLINARAADCREAYLRTLEARGFQVHSGQWQSMSTGLDVFANVTFRSGYLEAIADALIYTFSGSIMKLTYYEPHLALGTITIAREDRVRLAFVGYVFTTVCHHQLTSGALINAIGHVTHIRLARLMNQLDSVVASLKAWIENPPSDAPPVVLNDHCTLCPFRTPCLIQAEKEDDLSLLDRMTPKLMEKYHKKGIFTVTQLSYVFSPKRRRRKSRKSASRFNIELQALALRTRKIYVHELPSIPEHHTELFLDIEGVPDCAMSYLVGLVVSTSGHFDQYSLWADSPAEERMIFNTLMNIAQRYPDAPIYHYGGYEPRVLGHIVKKYRLGYDSIKRRLVNVNSFVFDKIYFPTRSNTLKALGRFIGAVWTESDASGLQSIVWRLEWEASHSEVLKEQLIAYNLEDCHALQLLVSELRNICKAASIRTDVDFADTPKQTATAFGQHIHSTLERIIRSAHYVEYGRKRISMELALHETIKRDRGGPKGHQGYRRIVPAKVDKIVRVRRSLTCPKDKGVRLVPTGSMSEHVTIDLVFTRNGCRKKVTKYVGEIARCKRCSHVYAPPAIRRNLKRRRVFGHAFRAWAVYQRLVLQLPYSAILQMAKDLFREPLSEATIIEFVADLAQYYITTENALLRKILASPFAHVDETKINIQGTDHYVWVLTDGIHVVFRLTETRESAVIKKILDGYDGVLISDFYGGYDACKCRQQKCLVHLIRDLNDDLWKNPYDSEIEGFISDFKDVLVPIMTDVENYGLKRRHLNKHRLSVDRFYRRTIDGQDYKDEATRKYQKRFARYRDSLFRFLEEDGIPWNNNLAERAIRHLAIQRKISGSFFKRVTLQYLRLLGIAQSCRFQGKSFLGFLLSGDKDIDRFKERKLPKTSRPVTATKRVHPSVSDKKTQQLL